MGGMSMRLRQTGGMDVPGPCPSRRSALVPCSNGPVRPEIPHLRRAAFFLAALGRPEP
jgi:hypothetical protein